MARDSRGRRRPHETGPRLFRRGRWCGADLRPWGGERWTLRNPEAHGWPDRGERTEDEEVARRWSWAYVDYCRDAVRRRQLGLRPRSKSLGQLKDEYLDHRRAKFTANTVHNDRSTLMHLEDKFSTAFKPADLTLDEVQEMFDERLAQGYAASTLVTYRTALASFIAYAGGDSAMVWRIKLPKVARTEDARALTDDEIERVREAADQLDKARNRPPSARQMVELFLCTGARQQEGFALEWRDISPQRHTVRFTRQLDRGFSGIVPLKDKLARTALVLPEWWEHHDASASGPVLRRKDGRYLLYRSQAGLIGPVLAAAGILETGIRFHVFRHTYARLFIERGGRMEELQKSLGHESVRTTEGRYGHFHEDVAAKLAASRIYPSGGLRVVS